MLIRGHIKHGVYWLWLAIVHIVLGIEAAARSANGNAEKLLSVSTYFDVYQPPSAGSRLITPWPTTWPCLPQSPLARPVLHVSADVINTDNMGRDISELSGLRLRRSEYYCSAPAGVRLQSSFQLRQHCVRPSHRRIPHRVLSDDWPLWPVSPCIQCPAWCVIVCVIPAFSTKLAAMSGPGYWLLGSI